MVAIRRQLVPPHPLDRFAEALWYVVQAISRPQTREQCRGGPRPCPWASCEHHLLGEVTQYGSFRVRAHDPCVGWRSKTINPNHPRDERALEDMAGVLTRLPDTCELDVIERAAAQEQDVTTAQIAERLRLSPWRTRQAERDARAKIATMKADLDLMTRTERKRRTAAYQKDRGTGRMTSPTKRTNDKRDPFPHASTQARRERAEVRKARRRSRPQGDFTWALEKHFAAKRLKEDKDK